MSSKAKNWYWRIKIIAIGLFTIACHNTNTKKNQTSEPENIMNGSEHNSVSDSGPMKESDLKTYSNIPKHNNPDQEVIDSIKAIKTKKKVQ